MRINYDTHADAAYISFTEAALASGRDSIQVAVPGGVDAMVILDWKDGKIVGLEILDAASILQPALLELTEPPIMERLS